MDTGQRMTETIESYYVQIMLYKVRSKQLKNGEGTTHIPYTNIYLKCSQRSLLSVVRGRNIFLNQSERKQTAIRPHRAGGGRWLNPKRLQIADIKKFIGAKD